MALKPSKVKRKSTCTQYRRYIYFFESKQNININQKERWNAKHERKKSSHQQNPQFCWFGHYITHVSTFVAGKLPTHRFNHLSFRVHSPEPIAKLIDASVTSHQNWDEWSPLTRHRSVLYIFFIYFLRRLFAPVVCTS